MSISHPHILLPKCIALFILLAWNAFPGVSTCPKATLFCMLQEDWFLMHNLVPHSSVGLNYFFSFKFHGIDGSLSPQDPHLPCTHHLHQHFHLTPTFCPPVFLVRDCVRAHIRLAHINPKTHWTENHSSVCSTQILLVPHFYIKFLNHLLCSSHIFHDLKFMYVCMCDTTHMWRSEVSLHL